MNYLDKTVNSLETSKLRACPINSLDSMIQNSIKANFSSLRFHQPSPNLINHKYRSHRMKYFSLNHIKGEVLGAELETKFLLILMVNDISS